MRKLYFRILGMKIGKGTNISKIYITWPHKVSFGNNCYLEFGSYFKFDGIWSESQSIIIEDEVFIGSNCEFNIKDRIIIRKGSSIASGCRFIDHNHGQYISSEKFTPETAKKIVINENVWLGCNVIVLEGVEIGKCATIGAGSVVTKSVPEYETWVGIPAKKIK